MTRISTPITVALWSSSHFFSASSGPRIRSPRDRVAQHRDRHGRGRDHGEHGDRDRVSATATAGRADPRAGRRT